MKHTARRIGRGARTVDGITVTITELIWPNMGRRFQVHRADTGTDLTMDGHLDGKPGDDDIRELIAEASNLWRCPGCGTAVDVDDHDLKADHMLGCLPGTVPGRGAR